MLHTYVLVQHSIVSGLYLRNTHQDYMSTMGEHKTLSISTLGYLTNRPHFPVHRPVYHYPQDLTPAVGKQRKPTTTGSVQPPLLRLFHRKLPTRIVDALN